jgi:hypothetical protein
VRLYRILLAIAYAAAMALLITVALAASGHDNRASQRLAERCDLVRYQTIGAIRDLRDPGAPRAILLVHDDLILGRDLPLCARDPAAMDQILEDLPLLEAAQSYERVADVYQRALTNLETP